jgi:AcrR family transcriptional regulator
MKNETPSLVIPAVASRRGRPRDSSIDSRLILATQRLLLENGYSSLSLERVAAAAGVSRPTLYRRYRSKVELVAAALNQMPALGWQPPDGDTKSQIVWALELFASLGSQVDPWTLLGVVLSEAKRHPEWLEAVRQNLIDPRRRFLKQIVLRGIASGQVSPEVDPDLAVDLLTGPIFMRWIAAGSLPPDWPRSLVDDVWPLLASGIAKDVSS